jgi:protein-disulfide isomerase
MDTNKIAIPASIVIAGLLIAGSLYLSSSPKSKADKVAPTINTTENEIRKVTESDHILGNPNAPLVLVEYSDTECPYCKQFHSTMNKIMETYGKDGKIAWVYRHFPIDQLHSKARKEAQATECAFDQGGNAMFWKYTNTLYERTTSNDTLNPNELPKIAKEVGLNVDLFNDCLKTEKFKDKVEADYQDAVKAGAQGTPHSIIILKDGSKVPIQGAQPEAKLKSIIDTLLK